MPQRTFSHFGYLAGFLGVLALSALPGCAADDADEAAPADPSSEDEIKQSPAVKAFLKDPAVKAEIGGRKYSPPQTALIQGGSFGRPVSTYIVATYVDVTRPDIMDAHVTKTVLGKVFVGPTGNTTVSLADLKDLDSPRESSAFAIASKEGAISIYSIDTKIKAALADKNASPPVALQLTDSSSFGRPVNSYLVLSTYDATPPGMLDARITKAVYGHVFFRPSGEVEVSTADVVAR